MLLNDYSCTTLFRFILTEAPPSECTPFFNNLFRTCRPCKQMLTSASTKKCAILFFIIVVLRFFKGSAIKSVDGASSKVGSSHGRFAL